MTYRPALALVAAAVLTAACSSGGSVDPGAASSTLAGTSPTGSAAASTAALSPCSAVFQPGVKVVQQASPTLIMCKDPDGNTEGVRLGRCNDGSYLGTVEAHTGAPRGWFVLGDVFHAADIASDPGFGAVYRKCHA